MLAHEVEPKMFYVKRTTARIVERVWVEDVALYEKEEMVQVTFRWIDHPRPNVIERGLVTQQMHWRGLWSFQPEVYVVQELP